MNKKRKYIYTISNNSVKDDGYKQSFKALDKMERTKGFTMQGKVFEDVDGSLIAVFQYEGGKVLLKNDANIGALFIESDNNIEDIMYK